MPTLAAIPGLQSADQDLLEAAGWSDLRLLALADPGVVADELARANQVLKLSKRTPDESKVRSWIEAAQRVTGVEPEETEASPESGEGAVQLESEAPTGPVNFEDDPEIREMISRAPLAIPVENRLLADQGIRPFEIAVAPVLSHASGDLEIRINAAPRRKAPAASGSSRSPSAGMVTVAEPQQGQRRGIDTTRVRSVEEVKDAPMVRVEKPRSDEGGERINLLRTPREETNRGRRPGSRFYIRGVLHDRPIKVWIGCLIVVVFQWTLPLALLAAPLLILSQQSPANFGWVPEWLLAFPLAVPVLGLLYFTVSAGVKCRVCGQRVLVPRHCRKNSKAHHVRGLGYIMPTALHTMIFRWFNCTFCGTSVRIKE